MDVTLRWCTDDDWERVARADERGFGFSYAPGELDQRRPLQEMDRFLVAELDGRIVGVTGDYPMQMTVPGGGSLPVPGVTWVSVAPGYRRRGILSALMAEQHRRFTDEGLALAILTASEGVIYGRFGYGPASVLRRLEVDRRAARLHPRCQPPGQVRLVEADEARRLVPELHERWRRTTPGAISRSAVYWDYWFADHEFNRDGGSKRFCLLHPDGYATYRTHHHWNDGHPDHVVEVDDLFPVTPEAHLDLWAFLLDLDLYGPIRTWKAPLDDPLPFLLADPRRARTLVANDGMWVRLLDVATALAARTYAVDLRVVLDVDDPVWGRGGRFLLEGGTGGAACVPTSEPADLALGIGALGSAYLGGHRLATLARAGLVEEHRPGALGQADAAFGAERAPLHGTPF